MSRHARRFLSESGRTALLSLYKDVSKTFRTSEEIIYVEKVGYCLQLESALRIEKFHAVVLHPTEENWSYAFIGLLEKKGNGYSLLAVPVLGHVDIPQKYHIRDAAMRELDRLGCFRVENTESSVESSVE